MCTCDLIRCSFPFKARIQPEQKQNKTEGGGIGKKRSRREKDNRTQRRRAENKRGWAEQRRWKAKPQRNKPAVRLFVRCVGGWRHDSHCRSKFSTIVSANEGSSRYTGSGKRRLRFKPPLSLSLSLCIPVSTPFFPSILSRVGFFPTSRDPSTAEREIWIEKRKRRCSRERLTERKNRRHPLCSVIFIATVVQTSTRGLASSLPVEDSTTIGNFLCRFRLYGLFTVEFLRIRLLVSVTILAQTSIRGIVYVCGELQCY